ncbi:putative secretion ATPase (PEP-CTERM system associated) [Pseudoduganella flava]|uniref:AAA family ATPase n=1 Tax=Pseudoduganella flava TaxID=871742 RepID=A0A562PNY3_9BURK|nr:XrtA/PEP-CTERM system-associated ATPase [Pseudoduganella flava]QGZ40594.1 AAA family ATPase [Pseudoduganella flava]TWI46043.1 putative secretion ATPase (PEP-CTERM system associated) [Pseudoduganella flava]
MYESYYGLLDKPFRLRPDPQFFFGSKGHKRAMAYLDYGLAQGEGFIVITGEVGAGKTTLVRNLFRKIASDQIVAAHIVNTHVDSDDILRGVVAAFGLPFEDSASKTTLLARLEAFLRECDGQGKRALLVVDEAQNLTPRVVEELRMLSNFQTDDKPLLQTFLLGQPEFRATLHSPGMQQLRQRVIATYHLGPMDELETQAYIEHRLLTVGWKGDPSFTPAAYAAIYQFTGGIPRKTNHLCDRLLLMGFLEEMHAFTDTDVDMVIRDIAQEFEAPAEPPGDPALDPEHAVFANQYPSVLDERMLRLEKSMGSVLSILKKIVRTPAGANQVMDGNQ